MTIDEVPVPNIADLHTNHETMHLFLAELNRKTTETANSLTQSISAIEAQIEALGTTSISDAIAEAVAALPAVTYYEKTFRPSGGFEAINHNLGTETPLWSISQEINSAVIFALDMGDENTSYLNFNATPSQDITITMARIVMPSTEVT